jgi:hypothetical protein
MKVKQLISLLQDCDPEMEVYATYPYGDTVNSNVAKRLHDAYTEEIVWSDYHQMYKKLDDDEDIEYFDKTKEVVVLV